MINAIHVLLVEDNAADVDLTREMLMSTGPGLDISVAADGVEAIDMLQRQGVWPALGQPTLVLLDLNLPRKDGRHVLSVIKSDDELRRIPVVILSSSDSDKDITSCYNLGANCYIVKPANLAQYRALVRTLKEFWLDAVKLPRNEGHSDATRIGYGD